MYYKPTAYSAEILLTEEKPGVYYGVPDWVYEEEVFSSNSAVWFSPNGSQIAYIEFDDTPTHIVNLPFYGEAGSPTYQYPFNRIIPYPKAGSENPRVALFITDLQKVILNVDRAEHTTQIPVPSALNTENNYLITVVDWLDNQNVLSVWMNRIQNEAYIQTFDGLFRRQSVSKTKKFFEYIYNFIIF